MLNLRRRNKPGRYTVGLTNRANDCFANSNLQALAAVHGLYLYLIQYGYLIPEGAAGKKQGQLGQLSKALAAMIRALNKPILAPEALSPWQLLVVLERIYKSRISRSQHDAHELLHLILETLQTENDKLKKALEGSPTVKIPEFPFHGATIDRITCSRCGYCPPATPSTFLVLSLMVPQRRSVSLNDLLGQLSTPEYIKDYGCTNCRLQAYVRSVSQFDERLKPYINKPWDLPEELERQIAGWPKQVTSPIAKSTAFDKLPQVLTLHLSRSIYGGFGASRNSCKVSVPEYLQLFEEEVRYKISSSVGNALNLNNGGSAAAESPTTQSINSIPTAESSSSSASSGQSMKSNSSATSMADTTATNSHSITRKKITYRLSALIRHKGTHQTGHYECFRRKNLKWWTEVYEGNQTDPHQLIHQKSPSATVNGQAVNGGPSNGTDAEKAQVQQIPASADASTSALGDLPYPGRCSPSPASVSASDVSTAYQNRSSSSATIVKAMNEAAEARSAAGASSGGREWWKISDEKVWECTTKDVLKEESGAYLLFYERV
ncbi:hypothetical protein TRVA0_025S00518 [Trichomonascus vanleenenianus]|uniref:putative ubiquitin-specific protease UBP16 n=1 Tax=Trichomonascus vanleenenianus TaxID=2268995 RepID=UPI003ECA7B01